MLCAYSKLKDINKYENLTSDWILLLYNFPQIFSMISILDFGQFCCKCCQFCICCRPLDNTDMLRTAFSMIWNVSTWASVSCPHERGLTCDWTMLTGLVPDSYWILWSCNFSVVCSLLFTQIQIQVFYFLLVCNKICVMESVLFWWQNSSSINGF